MSTKLKRNGSSISVVLVSGIPGAGKGRLAATMAKLFQNEKLIATDFKMPTVQASCRYNTADFVKALKESVDPSVDVVVAALPAYHHLKKAIFELRKSEDFCAQFDIKYVVTKVAARNFYQNRNRNLYPFLVENCLRGVCHAVIFEHSTGVPQSEVDLMTQTLNTVNTPDAILPVHGTRRHFDMEFLAQIFIRQNDRFNMLYTKHFYGFEKEGSCMVHRDAGAISGHFFNYRYPLRRDLIDSTLRKMLNRPLWQEPVQKLLPKNEWEQLLETENKENEENRINALEPKERRRYDREQRKRAQLEAD